MNVGKTPVWQQRQRESQLPCKPTAPSYLEKVFVHFCLNRVDPWERHIEGNPLMSSIYKGHWEDSKFKLLEGKELLSASWKLLLELSNSVNSRKDQHWAHGTQSSWVLYNDSTNQPHKPGGDHFHLSLSRGPRLGRTRYCELTVRLSEAVAKRRPLPLLTFPTCGSTKLVEGRTQLLMVQNFDYYTRLDISITKMRLLIWIQWWKAY